MHTVITFHEGEVVQWSESVVVRIKVGQLVIKWSVQVSALIVGVVCLECVVFPLRTESHTVSVEEVPPFLTL